MDERSVFDKSFLNLIKQWLKDSGEIYIVIRYSHAAGSKDYLLIHSFTEFEEKLISLPAKTEVIVFRQRQLPIRGVANELLLKRTLAEIPEGVEWTMKIYNNNKRTIESSIGGTETHDETHEELIEAFQEYKGTSIAVGKSPVYWVDDHDDMQSALVPMKDGSLVRGIY